MAREPGWGNSSSANAGAEPSISSIDALKFRSEFENPIRQSSYLTSGGSKTSEPQRPQVLDFLANAPDFKPVPRATFVAIQEWEGTVISRHGDHFAARLIDLTDQKNGVDEEAIFPISEVNEIDLDLLSPGAVFRWAIGIQRLPGGTKQRISQLVFRRLPQWTKSDIARADEIAAGWAARFAKG